MAGTAVMAGNDWKCLDIVGNCYEWLAWLELAGYDWNDQKWLEWRDMAVNSLKFFAMARNCWNGWKKLEMAGIG